MTTPAQHLRALLSGPGITTAVSAYDGLVARIMAAEGFETLFISGNATSTSVGLADLGLTTMSEVVERTRHICGSVDIPVIVDADTGYGNALNVQRTVVELERAGAAGVMIEDQTFPKRCGQLSGKAVIARQLAIGKLHAALDARRDEQTVIIARTDSRAVEGLEAAIERAQAYAEAGADVIFVETPGSTDEMSAVAHAVRAPLMSTESIAGHILSIAELENLGYKLFVVARAVTAAVFRAARDLARHVKAHGTVLGYEHHLVHRDEIDRVIGLHELIGRAAVYDRDESPHQNNRR